MKKGNFKGKCTAYSTENHHAYNCKFFRKLRKCLDYMKHYLNAANEIRKDHKQFNTYNKKNVLARKYVHHTFIPYDNVDSDLFLNKIDDEDYFIQYN